MRPKIRQNFVRLPLDEAYNVRDLGGYGGINKKQTKFHVFLRSDNPSNMTKDDIQYLKDYGVTASIDLRGKSEAEENPNPLQYEEDIHFVNIPFITDGIMDVRKATVPGFHVAGFRR